MMAYSKEQIEKTFTEICRNISGGKSLRSVLKNDDMPSSRIFYKWLDSDKDKVKQYTRATDERALEIFEDIMNISDNVGNDMFVDDNGREIINHAVIQRDRLRVDSRKWMLSKMIPKKYGDKQIIDSTHTIKDFDIKSLYARKTQ